VRKSLLCVWFRWWEEAVERKGAEKKKGGGVKSKKGWGGWPVASASASASKGHSKQKVTGPYVVGWFLGGPKSTRDGQGFLKRFLIVFLNSPHQEAPKNAIKTKSGGKKLVWIFLSIAL
jgi:hypothetical protein